MTDNPQQPARLYLVTPPDVDPEVFAGVLDLTLSAADIAAVLIAGDAPEHEVMAVAGRLVPVIQSHGTAAIVENHLRVASRTGADGVHISAGIGLLRSAVEQFRPQRIVGAGNLADRHAAMLAGETGVDYVFFGRAHGDIRPEPHPKNIALAEWWSGIFEIPAVVMAGRDIESVAQAVATGAEFIALQGACWDYDGGPAAAVARATDLTAARMVA